MMPQRLGEVVEADTFGLTAEAYVLYEPPPLGSVVLVHTGPYTIFAVVHYAATTSIDPGRLAVALGRDAASEAEVLQNQPQVALLLRTIFKARIVAYSAGTGVVPALPPVPPRVHSFVLPCGPQELQQLTERPEFLRLLLSPGLEAAEEVVSAFLRWAATTHPEPQRFLDQAGRSLALLLSQDLPRLTTILERARPIGP